MTHDRILVTGATGFTGGRLCEKLASEGHAVRALVRDPAARIPGVEKYVGDLRDPASLSGAVKGIDVVYHIAALYRKANASRKEMWETNVTGTRNLLDASMKVGVRRFVHCSTVGVHGDVKNPPANEETPYGPGDSYQESKTEGERVVLRCMKEERLPIAVFRPAGIYGPGDLRFLKLIRGIAKGTFIMIGSGEVIYQMIYIDDLVEGIRRCGAMEDAVGNVYILAGEEPMTLNQLVRLISEILKVPPRRLRIPFAPVYAAGCLCEFLCKPLGINPPLFRRRVDFFRKTRWFDISKARRELGFQPKTNLKTGIGRTVDWYREKGLLR